MKRSLQLFGYSAICTTVAALMVGVTSTTVKAQSMYSPLPLSSGEEIEGSLSEKDIPTGEGGFARDYTVKLEKGDQVAIDLISDEFDPIVILLGDDGTKIAENDDGPDGTTNSLLFARITEAGEYIVRVRAFGETGGGKFSLTVTRLKPVEE